MGEITEAAAVAQVSAANVTSVGMTGTCVASLPKKFSVRCTMDLLAKNWLLQLFFHPETSYFHGKVSTLQHIVAKWSKFAIADLSPMGYLDEHGVITMYLTDTPQYVGHDQIEEGVTVMAKTKFVQEEPLMSLAAGLHIEHTSFTTRFTVGHFAKSPAKPTLTFNSLSNHTVVKHWDVSKFGFVVDLQAATFALKMTGQLIAEFGKGKQLAMDITGTISKNAVPTKVVAVANRWRNFYGHVGLDLVNVVTTCDVKNIHKPVLSMTAKLPLGGAVVSMSGTIVAAKTGKIYLTGSVAKLSVKQLRAWMGGVSNAKNVISDRQMRLCSLTTR